jgi:hypothetical protein
MMKGTGFFGIYNVTFVQEVMVAKLLGDSKVDWRVDKSKDKSKNIRINI